MQSVSVENELPPLTGHPELDKWRLRARAELAGTLPPPVPSGERVPTRSELVLWSLLEREVIGWKREYATGTHWFDFYCPTAKLAVEVDGGSHHGRRARERDAERDERHAEQGIVTHRFSADHVERDAEGVLREIRALVRLRLGLEDAGTPAPAGPPARPVSASGTVAPVRRASRRRVSRSRLPARKQASGALLMARLLLLLIVAVLVFLEVHGHLVSRWYLQGAHWFFQTLVERVMSGATQGSPPRPLGAGRPLAQVLGHLGVGRP